MNLDKEKALARKLRFSKTQPDYYGSISRSNDTRLKDDPQRGRDFFLKIQQAMTGNPNQTDLEWGFKCLGKLRESLLGQPSTHFSLSVYLYSVRMAVNHTRFQTYLPCLYNILRTIRFEMDIEESVISEMATYLCLHLAHFNNDLVAAFEVCFRYSLDDVRRILFFLATNDFLSWWGAYVSESCPGSRKIMSFKCNDMTKRARGVINCGYFMLEKSTVERWCGCSLDVMNTDFECRWAVKGESVVIRERVKK